MPNSDDDSDFAEYGTSLEPIEEDEVARKRPIAVQDQVALDERGRRRFHGAFTGGFSAGYFNTVGSKEGWTPSTFKSSRADRGAFKNQNVLDFMDDEDKGAFGIAPQVLRPTDDFVDRSDKNQARSRKRPLDQDGPIPGMSALEQIIQPVKETVGIKMLIKMGWRPGKGIGPKLNKRAKRSKMTPKEKEPALNKQSEVDIPDQEDIDLPSNTSGGEAKRYGCFLPPEYAKGGSDSEESLGDLSEAEKLLAPDDVSSLLCNPKENTFGLGYKGLDRNTLTSMSGQADLFGTKLKFRVGSKNMDISGQAFGVGAFEEADDDIYAREDMTQYDFALETPEERKRRKAKEESEKRKKKNKENCIEGFQICASTKLRRKVFPPPHLPPNFEPLHSTKKSRFEGDNTLKAAEAVTEVKGLDRHKLTIAERQVLIEESSNQIRKDVNEAQDKQEKTTTTEDDVNASKASEPKQSEKDIQERIEKLKKFTQVLQAYSSKTPEETDKVSFKPFMKNPEKQERYDKYLTLVKAGFSECLRDLQPSDMTDWEREREKMEFDRASKLYKPMNSVLSNRFVSAKSHDISHLEPEKEAVVQKDPKEDPKVAAQMKLFGKLTHRVVEWHPDKLVCKRFNIPHPYPDSKFVGIRGGDPSFSSRGSKMSSSLEAVTSTDDQKPAIIAPPPKKSLFEDLDFSKPPPGLLPPEQAQNAAASNVLDFQKEITSSSNKSEENDDSLPVEKPPLDLFKEIFADSSESEDEKEETPAKSTKVPPKVATAKESSSSRDKVNAPTKVSSNSKPDSEAKKVETQRRVFDRIDLDKLQHTTQSENNKTTDDHGKKSKDDDEDMDDAYGPLPPKSNISSSSSSALRPTFIPRSSMKDSFSTKSKGVESSGRAEDVVWVEKSAASESIKSSKSKKHSSKKSHKKSGKKDKHKSSKSKKHKKEHKKKNHKHKSKSKSKHVSGSQISGSDSESDSSDSSVTINDSLDNKNLLAKLKQFTKSK